jgi:hypothetical protein
MVIDPILNKTLVGSERYRTVQPQPQQQPPAFKNAATCLDLDDTEIPCDPAMCYTWEGYEMDCEKKRSFDWRTFGLGFQNTLSVLSNLVGSLLNGLSPNTVVVKPINPDRKILGMEPVTGAVVATIGTIAIIGGVGYAILKARGIPKP